MSVDPRIHLELEKLNNSCEKINSLEVSLDELKRNYQELQDTSQAEIKIICSKIKSAIDLARPFYEARKQSNELFKEKLVEHANYEKAKTNLCAAKEMVHLAEQSALSNTQGTGGLDIALQEMISHATSRVNFFTDECNKAQNRLRIMDLKHEMANIHVSKIQTQLKTAIKVSRPYYETRANYNAKLRSMKLRIIEMESEVQKAKSAYNEALQNLEKISDEIHKLREEQKLIYLPDDEVEFSPQPQSSKNKTYLCYQNSLSDDYELVDDDDDDDDDDNNNDDEEITPSEKLKPTEEWSDIPLNNMTASNSTTSSYSQTSDRDNDETLKNQETSINPNEKESKDDDKKSIGSGFSDWISKSSFRRQSLEDVFAQSTLFGKFGRSERRSSESEVECSSSSAKKEFFLFGRSEGLTDSQVESLFLPDEHL